MAILTATLVALLWSCILGLARAQAPVVDLGYAKYQGFEDDTTGITYFYGIPFAQPPIDQGRWRAPVEIETSGDPSGEPILATEVGPACYQSLPEWFLIDGGPAAAAQIYTPQGQSEDCLILNVLVPTKPAGTSLPVVIQIHPGGYTSNNGAFTTPGDALVNASDGNIIHVGIQYRLGVFGFLAGQEVAADGTLNAGLLDQKLAIEWVSQHISAFGGDPARITIWGSSAGGGSVTQHLIANGGANTIPFSAAIAEYPWWQPLLNTTLQDLQYSTTLEQANCPDLACLRALPSEELANVNQAVQNVSYPGPGIGYGLYYFGPVVDGTYVQDLPSEEFKAGRFRKVPLLLDREGYEGVLFSNRSITTQEEETADAKLVFPSADDSFFEQLYALYPASDFNSTFFQRAEWFGDFIINCPTWQMASAMADAGTTATFNASAVFKMIFNAGSQLHTATLPFLNSNVPGFPDANNHTLAEIMASYWISFITDHDPNPRRATDAPFWPSYSGGGPVIPTTNGGEYTVLDVEYGPITPTADPDASDRCEFFKAQGRTISN